MAAFIFFGLMALFGYIGYWCEKDDNKPAQSNSVSRSTSYPAPKHQPITPKTTTPNYSSERTQTTVKPTSIMTTQATVSKPAHTSLKSDASDIIELLKKNGVVYLYHFTDRRNLASIKKHGGLYSWNYCSEHGITIPYAGGNQSSRMNDMRFGLQDYVRLSLCDDHPMMWRLQQLGYDLVLLKIKIDAAAFFGTMFSDMNATDNGHHHGGSIEDLKRIRFSATRRRYVRRDDEDFKYHQAEVMVKTFIPAQYIINLNTIAA